VTAEQNHVGIQMLQGAYADAINRRAWAELEPLFAPSCEIVIDTRRGEPLTVVGGAGIGAFVANAIERFDFFEFVILSTRLWVDEHHHASGRLYMCEIRHDRESGRRSEAFGVYHDDYERVHGAWRFARRRYHSLARTSEAPDRDLDVFAFPATER
jgi:hypothetical protein